MTKTHNSTSIEVKSSHGKGFTLAEILITLTVIGVVAALTIPTLLQNTNQAELKAAWKKEFADINQATMEIANEKGGSLAGAFAGGNEMINAYAAHLNYIKICYDGTSYLPEGSSCGHVGGDNGFVYKLSGGKAGGSSVGGPSIVLNNGSMFGIDYISPNCNWAAPNVNRNPNRDACGYAYIDVNGFKKPNTQGKDIFAFYILNSGGILPYGIQGSYHANVPASHSCDIINYPNSAGENCSADYLYQ